MKMTWNYLAGFFDGEGHVRCDYHPSGAAKVQWQVTQRNLEVLDAIALFLFEYGYSPKFQPNRTKHCGVVFLNRIADVESICKRLRPRVIVKVEQIDSVLHAIENRQRRGTEEWRAARRKKPRPQKKHKTGAKLKR